MGPIAIELSTVGRAAASALAVLAGYLAGAVPFGYLVVRAVRGVDVRTLGSGNVGATNVGRVLGARYFWAVLALDLLKGFLPTWGLPRLLQWAGAGVPVDLPVSIALAAVLGHTFPVYLGFRGGKGVATSLGAVLALDPASCAAAALAFAAVLLATRFMSLASITGGLGFMAARFLRDARPLSREHIAMSLFSIGVPVLLIVRHRSNLARIWAGTENRVRLFGRSRGGGAAGTGAGTGTGAPAPERPERPPGAPSGRVALIVAIVLAAVAAGALAGAWIVQNAHRPIVATAGPWSLRELDRHATGQQRVDRVAFSPDGERLVGTCPRYHCVLTYRVGPDRTLDLIAEAELDGRPVGIVSLGRDFLVLVRPPGDEKHLHPGWYERFNRDGQRVGSRQPAGFYPDDLAVSPDGRFLYLLTSGRSEGDERKPMPALDVFEFASDDASPVHRGQVTFNPRDDPSRLNLSASGEVAAVFLDKSKHTVAVDLSDPDKPKRIGRVRTNEAGAPYVSSSSNGDWILMPTAGAGDTITIELPEARRGAARAANADGKPAAVAPRRADYLVRSRPEDSELEISQARPRVIVGSFPLLGPLNLGRTKPMGLAYSSRRGLIAVATRSGSIHLIAIQSRLDPDVPAPRSHADGPVSRVAARPIAPERGAAIGRAVDGTVK